MEDFVSFEIAKKLKEKGFREKCLTYYDVDDNVGLLYNTQYSDEMLPCQYTDLLMSHNTGEGRQPDDSDNCVDAPTISQVLKWLREEKKLYIMISPTDTIAKIEWSYDVGNISIHRLDWIDGNYGYNSYEEAALAGIECVIDNLI